MRAVDLGAVAAVCEALQLDATDVELQLAAAAAVRALASSGG